MSAEQKHDLSSGTKAKGNQALINASAAKLNNPAEQKVLAEMEKSGASKQEIARYVARRMLDKSNSGGSSIPEQEIEVKDGKIWISGKPLDDKLVESNKELKELKELEEQMASAGQKQALQVNSNAAINKHSITVLTRDAKNSNKIIKKEIRFSSEVELQAFLNAATQQKVSGNKPILMNHSLGNQEIANAMLQASKVPGVNKDSLMQQQQVFEQAATNVRNDQINLEALANSLLKAHQANSPLAQQLGTLVDGVRRDAKSGELEKQASTLHGQYTQSLLRDIQIDSGQSATFSDPHATQTYQYLIAHLAQEAQAAQASVTMQATLRGMTHAEQKLIEEQAAKIRSDYLASINTEKESDSSARPSTTRDSEDLKEKKADLASKSSPAQTLAEVISEREASKEALVAKAEKADSIIENKKVSLENNTSEAKKSTLSEEIEKKVVDTKDAEKEASILTKEEQVKKLAGQENIASEKEKLVEIELNKEKQADRKVSEHAAEVLKGKNLQDADEKTELAKESRSIDTQESLRDKTKGKKTIETEPSDIKAADEKKEDLNENKKEDGQKKDAKKDSDTLQKEKEAEDLKTDQDTTKETKSKEDSKDQEKEDKKKNEEKTAKEPEEKDTDKEKESKEKDTDTAKEAKKDVEKKDAEKKDTKKDVEKKDVEKQETEDKNKEQVRPKADKKQEKDKDKNEPSADGKTKTPDTEPERGKQPGTQPDREPRSNNGPALSPIARIKRIFGLGEEEKNQPEKPVTEKERKKSQARSRTERKTLSIQDVLNQAKRIQALLSEIIAAVLIAPFLLLFKMIKNIFSRLFALKAKDVATLQIARPKPPKVRDRDKLKLIKAKYAKELLEWSIEQQVLNQNRMSKMKKSLYGDYFIDAMILELLLQLNYSDEEIAEILEELEIELPKLASFGRVQDHIKRKY